MSVFVFSAITFSACAVLFEDVFGEIFLFMREREGEYAYMIYTLGPGLASLSASL